MSRHLALAALAVAACRPSQPYTAPQTFVIAQFDPVGSGSAGPDIPLPNDLVLLQPPNSFCTPPSDASAPACAQAELLQSFKDANGFPGDQATPVTIDFIETTFGSGGVQTNSAPDLDLSSFTPDTYFVEGENAAGTGEVPMAPIGSGDYVKYADHGTLTLHYQDNLPWPAGEYAVLIRGGSDGIMTTDGLPVYPSEVFALLRQNVDLTNPANNGLLKAELGSEAAAAQEGIQLNLISALWNEFAFPSADTRFPHQELAILTTFAIQRTPTNVAIDPTRGLAPLPFDLLRDPTTGLLTPTAACALAGASLAADGSCPSPLASGFEALDGFATTGAILAPTSDYIDATTVNGSDLQLWDLTDAANPVLVDPSTYIAEPCEFTQTCAPGPSLSPVIAAQPAGATASDATSVFRTKPLKDDTDYAVVLTTAIKDKAGNPIGPGTVAKILHFSNPLYANGHSTLTSIDDATAEALEKMRLQLQPVFAALAAKGTDFSQIGIAYTFHTQTILSQANQLAALPYDSSFNLPGDDIGSGSGITVETAAAAFAKYGVDGSVVAGSDIGAVLEFDIDTWNNLNLLTGAFNTSPTSGTSEQIHVLMALPLASNANIPACQGSLAPFGGCAPLMVFRHGLGGGRADMLTVANEYAKAGMITVAIDAAKHGDRAFCTPGVVGECQEDFVNGSANCTTALPSGAQGDAEPPGSCPNGQFTYEPVSASCESPANPPGVGNTCGWLGQEGIPVVAGNYLITTNFFRTRDTLRQDLIDQSQLIRTVAYVPTATAPTNTITGAVELFSTTAGSAFTIDPTTIFYSGQSLGSIQGAADVATNPRISKAAFNVGGGTVVDVFTSSPAFTSTVDALLASIGITPGSSAYLQFLVVAKTVLDPADPINFVGHIQSDTLPNLLGSGSDPARSVLAQNAWCDQTVPNPWNFIFANNLGVGPLPDAAGFGTGSGTFQLFVSPGFTGADCTAGAVEHAFITDWADPVRTMAAQDDIARFLMTNPSQPQPSLVETP